MTTLVQGLALLAQLTAEASQLVANITKLTDGSMSEADFNAEKAAMQARLRADSATLQSLPDTQDEPKGSAPSNGGDH